MSQYGACEKPPALGFELFMVTAEGLVPRGQRRENEHDAYYSKAHQTSELPWSRRDNLPLRTLIDNLNSDVMRREPVPFSSTCTTTGFSECLFPVILVQYCRAHQASETRPQCPRTR